MAIESELDGLEQGVEALELSLGQAAGMAAGFDAELKRIHATFDETHKGAARLERTLSSGVKRAIDDVILDGATLGDALKTVGQSMVNAAYNAAVRPVANHLGGMLAQGVGAIFGPMQPFAKGGAFTDGRVVPFANGGVVNGPTTFPMRGGATGLMGEAGPEAIMPLTRGADGRLGVRAQGGGSVHVVMNIQTPDVEGFRRSQSQIAAQMGRALGRGQRNR